MAQIVNDLIIKPDMPSKGQIINQLMDGVLLTANADIQFNLKCNEALKSELYTSYPYLCTPSNFLTIEIFGCVVASWLVNSSPGQSVRVQALAEDIVLCSWARHFTHIVPLHPGV